MEPKLFTSGNSPRFHCRPTAFFFFARDVGLQKKKMRWTVISLRLAFESRTNLENDIERVQKRARRFVMSNYSFEKDQ